MRNIEILGVIHLRGPNIWTWGPVLEAWVNIHDLEDAPSNTVPGMYERLEAWLPGLIEHRCSPGVRGGFLQRLREGTWPGHVLEHVTLELLGLAGQPGGFGRARETSRRGVYKVVVSAPQEALTEAALYAARDLVMAAIDDEAFPVDDAVARLRELADDVCLGPSTACIVNAATQRGIAHIRLNDRNLVQLGYGAARRRVWTAETDNTGAIAESTSRDKDLTRSLLEECGLPVPRGYHVSSAGEAWQMAQQLGLPVVVKPGDGNHGRGVFIALTTRAEVHAAYDVAVAEGSSVIVERFIPGNEHRLLVVGGRMVAAAAGEPAWVVGDGHSSVLQLIDTQLNADPRRGQTELHPLNPVRVDSAVRLELARQGFDAQSVPAAGQRVLVQRHGNVANDVTDVVHPSAAGAAELAARVVGLDIAGIDMVVEDIAQPLHEQGGAIVEVNAGPGLLMHLRPATGSPRPVGEAIVNSLFKPEEDGRIPLIGISGTNGKTTVARLLAQLLGHGRQYVGLACSDGLQVAGRWLTRNNAATWKHARQLLINPHLQVGIIENGSDVILGEGLAYDMCQVGVVTNIGEGDFTGNFDIHEPGQLYTVFRTQVDVVLPQGVAVLNADDPGVVEMAQLCQGEVVYFATDASSAVVQEHLARGGRAIACAGNDVVLLHQGQAQALIGADAVLAAAGQLAFQLQNFLAAVAAAWAVGMSPAALREACAVCLNAVNDATWGSAVLRRGDVTVIVDHAQNVPALRALVQSLQGFSAARRRAIYGIGQYRLRNSIIAQGHILADAFDQLVFYDDASALQQWPAGHARELLKQGVMQSGKPVTVKEEATYQTAVATALNNLQAGDLLLVQSQEANRQQTCNLLQQWYQQQ